LDTSKKVLIFTHASIAAYSTGVPTLVLGYSNKAVGIAHDLSLDDFVVDISRLDDNGMLAERFERLRTGYPKNLNMAEYAGTTRQYVQYI
jgi:polysaccharide pyruvyl transferase WcaK-like protein